jgi:hypothetical protein
MLISKAAMTACYNSQWTLLMQQFLTYQALAMLARHHLGALLLLQMSQLQQGR